MTALSKPAQSFIQTILKHYPLEAEKQNNNSQPTTSKHKAPQQHMHDYRKEREIYDKPTKEKLQNMVFFKEEGNNHYKNGRFSEACYFYQKTIIYGDYTFPENETDTATMDDLLQKTNCNLAICLIKLDQWDKAKTNLNEATKGKDPKLKEKALYWLTKYYIRSVKEQKAREQIDKLKELGAQCVKELSLELQKAASLNQEKQRKVCGGMFSK